MELGYGFTSTVDECRSALAGLGAREISPLAAARVLSHMARTYNGLNDAGGLQSFRGDTSSDADGNAATTWNVEVFIQTLKEIVSFLSLFIIYLLNYLLINK